MTSIPHKDANPFDPLATLLALPDTWQVQVVQVGGEMPIIRAELDPAYLPEEACECGERCWAHGAEARTWHYARSVGGKATVVRLSFRRFVCRACRRTRGHEYPKVLPELREEIARYAIYHTVADTARAFGLSLRETRNIAAELLGQWVDERVIEPPQYLAIDVTYKGGMGLCTVVDVARGRVIEILNSKATGELTRYLKTVARTWPDLRCVAIDADKKTKAIIEQALPGVPIVLDRFHVVRAITNRLLAYLELYKKEHGVAVDGRLLINPKLDSYPALAARLTAEGHGRLLELFEYIRDFQVIYDQAVEAEVVWDAWCERVPPELAGPMKRTVQDLNRHWRRELCAAVEFRVPSRKRQGEMVLIGTNMAEALHNRTRRVVADSRRITFGLLRLRLLMMRSGEELTEQHRAERAWLQELRRAG